MPMTASQPKAFTEIAGRRVLDWTLDAFRDNGLDSFVFVGGYLMEKVRGEYPDLTFVENAEWPTTNILYSLLCARDHFRDGFYATYTDTLFRPDAVQALDGSDHDITLVMDAPQREVPAGPIGRQAAVPGISFVGEGSSALIGAGEASVGSLAVARSFFTATLLNDGRVLVAGGQDTDNLSLKSSEIYDPATGKWSPTGDMTNGRRNHRATLLQDGRVLVTGGLDVGEGVLQSQEGKGVISLAEIYDPATGVWEATADMSKARTLHQSVLLQDGKVLVIGGGDSDYEPIASVDIYDPSAGTWTETSELIKARQEHTATVLSDGRVLVTGGGRIDATETSEIYDPSTGAWSEAGEMIAGRIAGVSALLDDGRVLIAGGRGGYQWLAVSVRMAEIYDPATNSWSTAGDLLDIRHDHAATILSDGRVMVTGGVIAEGMGVRTLPMAEIYDATTNAWTATAGLAQARTAHSATLLSDGRVLVVGGNTSGGIPISTAEMYDPSAGTWSFAAAAP